MPLTLYGSTGSGSAAVDAALHLAGLAFDLVDAASWQPSAGLDSRPGLAALFDRLEAHPVAGPVLARHWPPAKR